MFLLRSCRCQSVLSLVWVWACSRLMRSFLCPSLREGCPGSCRLYLGAIYQRSQKVSLDFVRVLLLYVGRFVDSEKW